MFETPRARSRNAVSSSPRSDSKARRRAAVSRDPQGISRNPPPPHVASRPPNSAGSHRSLLMLCPLPAHSPSPPPSSMSAPYLLVGLKNIRASSPTETRVLLADCSGQMPPEVHCSNAKERRASACLSSVTARSLACLFFWGGGGREASCAPWVCFVSHVVSLLYLRRCEVVNWVGSTEMTCLSLKSHMGFWSGGEHTDVSGPLQRDVRPSAVSGIETVVTVIVLPPVGNCPQ